MDHSRFEGGNSNGKIPIHIAKRERENDTESDNIPQSEFTKSAVFLGTNRSHRHDDAVASLWTTHTHSHRVNVCPSLLRP
jgi:hypothetical protein